MPTYDELKVELKQIAKLLEEFPEPIRPQVFELLMEQYLGHPIGAVGDPPGAE